MLGGGYSRKLTDAILLMLCTVLTQQNCFCCSFTDIFCLGGGVWNARRVVFYLFVLCDVVFG